MINGLERERDRNQLKPSFMYTQILKEILLTNIEKHLHDIVITIDPQHSLLQLSCHKENQILFSMHMTFRIGEMTDIKENVHFYQVELTITSDNDEDLRLL